MARKVRKKFTLKVHFEKKKYVKPEVVSEKVFETAALACGKCYVGPIVSGLCRLKPKLS